HNLSDTVHDLICAILYGIFAQLAPSASGYSPARTRFVTIYGEVLRIQRQVRAHASLADGTGRNVQ
ncbi:MAG: hypothetical protein ACYDBH_22630, partial [Acidobacteriaceae bacterium]